MVQVLFLGGVLSCNTTPEPCPTIDGVYRVSYVSPGQCPLDEVVIPIEGTGQGLHHKYETRPDTTVHSVTNLRGCVMDLEITVIRNNNNKTVSLVDGRMSIQNDTSYLVGSATGTKFDEAYPDRQQILCQDFVEVHAARQPDGLAGALGAN